ncbi:MAG: nucleotidyltransferase family protein [Candidatus Aminicenantes bacterium]
MIWAVILAAGGSRRMGTQKMLLPFGDGTIVERVVRAALDASLQGIVVVLGADEARVREKLAPYPVTFAVNADWQRGMLSSVQTGFEALPEKATAVVVMLGDQPFIKAETVDELVAHHRETRKGIVLPVHGGRRGHPVLIDKKYGAEIVALGPEGTLREVVHAHAADVLEVEIDDPDILRDIDTPEDYGSGTV